MLQTGVVHAELDEMQQHLQRQFEVPLRWDNIEGAPEWVAGQSPNYSFSDGLHFVTLKPGEYTTVRVPRGAYLRLYQPSLELTHDEVTVQHSNGSGLYVNLPAVISEDGHSLITNVDMSQPSLIRVLRPETHQQEIKFALFISRFTAVGEVVPYRDVVSLPLPTIQLRRSDHAASQTYWQLQPQETFLPIVVEGPARYVFEHRLAYPETESQIQQAYRISAYLNGEPYQTMTFDTVTERSASVYVNWRKRVIGKLETGYINIPQGRHELQLSTTAMVYGRLIQQISSDYLFPGLNQPDVIDAETFKQVIKAPKQSIWSLDQQEIIQGALDVSSSPAEKQYLAQRLAKDNSRREGGMQAAMLMRNSAIDQLHDTKLQTVTNDARGFNTFYRNILPHTKSDEAPQSVKWFMSQQLHSLGEQNRSPVWNEQHLRNVLSRLSLGFFVNVMGDETVGNKKQNQQSSCEHSNCYYLPSRAGPGKLRVVVDLDESSNNAPLMIQIGDAKPNHMKINVSSELADSEYVKNLATVGLEYLQERLQAIGLAPTMDGAFARRHVHAPIALAGVFEFDVPANVSYVKFWKLGLPANTVRIALQYRTSKPSSFSEMEYLEAVRHFSDDSDVSHQFINAYSKKESKSVIEKELANHWLPLIRFLKSQSQLYISSVVDLKPLLTKENRLERKEVDHLREKAEQAQRLDQWLVALEIWSKIRDGSGAMPVIQRQAELARLAALYHLGEHFLMEQQLRGLLLYTQDETLRNAAFEKLRSYLNEIEEPEKLQLLLIAMFHTFNETKYLSELSEVLVNNGHYKMALMIGLVVPEDEFLLNSMIQAAYQLGWWNVFHTMVARISNHQEQNFWKAQFHVEQGDYSSALKLFELAGEQGSHWQQALQSGLLIRDDVTSNKDSVLNRWGQWLKDHPGPNQWREAHNMVVDHAGAVSLYNITRDVSSQAYQATADKPVKLSFIGPLTLRVDARPIHALNNDMPINGWLELRSKIGLRLLPINNNRLTDWPTVVGNDNLAVGQRVSDEFSFGSGHHEIELSSNDLSLLLNIYVQRPALDLGILPPLDKESIVKLFGKLPNFLDLSNNKNPDVSDWPEAPYLAAGHIKKAMALYSDQNKEESQRLMTLLLWLVEKNPEQKGSALVIGEALANAHPEVPQLRSLLARLGNDAGWLQMANIRHSAGLRYVELMGWRPENPSRRVRKALMNPIPPSEHVITGTNQMVLKINNLSVSTFKLTLLQNDIEYLAPVSMSAFYQIDEQYPVPIELTAEEPKRVVEIPLSVGQHTLRVGINNPVTNQFLSVGTSENGGIPITHSFERVYHVATHEEPIKFNVSGPVWLRIDTLKNEETLTAYRHVKSDWREIKIVPEVGEKESLVRVSQRLPRLRETEIINRRIAVTPEPVSDPLVAVQLKQNPAQVSLHDGFPLGRQEDGTWSFNSAAVSRRNFGDFSGSNDSERFIESSITHRYFNQNRRLYLRTDILGRSREHGSPTFGISESLIYSPLMIPLDFKLDGSLHVQQFNFLGDKNEEWAAFFNAAVSQRREINPKTWYIPELSTFQRAMSLSPSTADDDRLDQDVFTQYRADHRRGVRISNTLMHRPWLDTIWHSRFSAVSNENGNVFKPDHLWFSAGWRQLIGKADVDLSYRLVHFFADANRAESSNRHSILLNLAWNQWRVNQQRIEVGFRFRRDFDITSNNGMVYVSWHFGRGRMYRDFHPSKVSFMDTRQQHIPQTVNNHIGVSRD